SQLFFIAAKDEPASGRKAGLYSRDGQGWRLLVPGQLMRDRLGAPLITQLSLAKVDNNAYVVTVIDGQVHLLTGRSDARVPGSSIQFGSKENPLIDVGSMQPRFLSSSAGTNKAQKVSIYQDPRLTGQGSQLVIVSLQLDQAHLSGDGITFAFELLPSQEENQVRLNGRPIILDYNFHEQSQLSGFVATDGNNKLVYSSILVEQAENADLRSFGESLPKIQKWLQGVTSKALEGSSPAQYLKRESSSRVAYNTTEGRVERDLYHSREVFTTFNVRIEQKYLVSRGETETLVHIGNEKVALDGQIDSWQGAKMAIWDLPHRGELIFSKNRVLYAVVRADDRLYLAELGKLAEICHCDSPGELPTELVFRSVVSAKKTPIEPGVVILSMKFPSGSERTVAVRLNLLQGDSLKKVDSYLLLPFAVSQEELNHRLKNGPEEIPIFDTTTPRQESVAAYQQVYDSSRPHVDLYSSERGGLKYRFQKPAHTMSITKGLTYAEFSQFPGVENPSGLYLNIEDKKITGNEKDRVLGELLVNPFRPASEANKDVQNIFARVDLTDQKSEENDGEEDRNAPRRRMYLFGIDAAKKSGQRGYQLVLAGLDSEGAFQVRNLDLPRFFLSKLSGLKSAVFVHGRRQDRRHAYLLLSFEVTGQNETRTEQSYVVQIDVSKTINMKKVVPLEGVSLSPKDVQERVGFDQDGTAFLNLTPDLSAESSQFAVFNFKQGVREFPSKTFGGGGKKKIEFGGLSVRTLFDDSVVRSADSWHVLQYEVKNKYPSLGRSKDLSQFDSFITLGRELDEMSSTKKTPKRMILVVPSSLRELVWDSILAKGYSSPIDYGARNPEDVFDHRNKKLRIHVVNPQKLSQEQVLVNIESFGRTQERDVVVARMDEVIASQNGIPKPVEKQHPFTLSYVHATGGSDLDRVASTSTALYPSFLYLMAAGRPLSLREFRDDNAKPAYSSLIVATPEEMKSIERNLAHEIEYGMLDRFKIQEIKDPDPESMSASLKDVFKNADVQSLEYQFSAKEIKPRAELDSDKSLEVVIDYAVSRFLGLLGQKKESRFESFVRFRSVFALAVLSDREVRRTRLINKFFVERVLTQVFDIPMNLATLPADDPMVVLSGKDALLNLQAAGYAGPFELKRRVVSTLLSQTRAESGKPVPGSIILFGNTGSGKTFLFKTMVKMLKLKLYDFNDMSSNNDAQAIIINVGKLKVEEGEGREDDMDVDQALQHLNLLLATPNGYRSWILFDDVHAASEKVMAKILNWQRMIFESQDGMYSFAVNGQWVKRPVRNLNIWMTLNPTAEQDQIAKYAKDKLKPTVEEILLATLSTSSLKIEPSFLRRWGRIINLDYMPAGAKGPELLNKLAKASNTLLNTASRIVLVAPPVVSHLVRLNEQTDARSFLSASTSALVEVATSHSSRGALVLVVPSMDRSGTGLGPAESESERITNWVEKNTRTIPLDASLEGNLAFINMIVDSFRMPVYESLAMALQENPQLAKNPADQKAILTPVLAAVQDHLSGHPYVSLSDITISASDIGLKTVGERELFKSILKKFPPASFLPLYPPILKQADSGATTWHEVVGIQDPHAQNRRQQVIADAVNGNLAIIHQRLSDVLRVENVQDLPEPASWLSQLSGGTIMDPKLVGRQLTNNLLEFFPRLFQAEATEPLPEGISQLSIYEATRIFLFTVDRAMMQMKWVHTSRFLLKALELITEDQVLSQRPGVQSFLFTDTERLIKPSIPDFTYQIIASSNLLENFSPEAWSKQRNDFDRNVDLIISGKTPVAASPPTQQGGD
ncbi:MAG: hypothetical protein C5B49_09870, partial [Bdellovibrio sp.]